MARRTRKNPKSYAYPGTLWDYYEIGEMGAHEAQPVNRRNPRRAKKNSAAKNPRRARSNRRPSLRATDPVRAGGAEGGTDRVPGDGDAYVPQSLDVFGEEQELPDRPAALSRTSAAGLPHRQRAHAAVRAPNACTKRVPQASRRVLVGVLHASPPSHPTRGSVLRLAVSLLPLAAQARRIAGGPPAKADGTASDRWEKGGCHPCHPRL